MTKRYSLFLAVILLLFVSLITILCIHSRIATDDYWYIWFLKTYGIIESCKSQYMEWCGRFSTSFIGMSLYKLFGLNQIYYYFIPLGAFVLLVSGVYRASGGIMSYFNFPIPRVQRFLASLSFVALMYFLSIEKGEPWFWYVALYDYLINIGMYLWAFSFLFQCRYKFLSYIGMIVCIIYSGGSSEIFSIIFGIFITLFIIYKYREADNLRSFISSSFNKKLLLLYAVLGICFIIVIVAPGNYLRAGLLPESRFFYSFFIIGKSYVKYFIVFLPLQIPYIFIFSVVFILIGTKVKTDYPQLFNIPFKKFFINSTIFLLSILFLFFFILAYLMVERGPARVWLLVSFLFSMYVTVVAFYAGYAGLFDEKKISIIKKASITAGLLFMIFNVVYQYSVTSTYSSAIDSRNTYLIETNKTIKKDTLIKLTPLPDCGMLYSSDIQPDTSHFTNQELRLGFNLKFHVYVEKKAP